MPREREEGGGAGQARARLRARQITPRDSSSTIMLSDGALHSCPPESDRESHALQLALPTMEPVRTPAANYSMVSVAEAVETALGATRPLPPQDFSYIDALGLTLAEDVLARDPIPAYRASIKVPGGDQSGARSRPCRCL